MTSENFLPIVVIGAGVAGLTTALVLQKAGYRNLTIVAKHMPGDRSIEYTSPWAGANWVPVSQKGTREEEWDRITWREWLSLQQEFPEAGIHLTKKTTYFHDHDKKVAGNEWFKELVHNYRILGNNEVPSGFAFGIQYKTFCLDPTMYLSFLQMRCISQGAQFKRASLRHISEAFNSHHTGEGAALVVNCTGIMAAKLGGVEDQNIVPMKGQLVLVRNELDGMYSMNSEEDLPDGEYCYLMNRPQGGATVIGGSSHATWEDGPDPRLSERLMRRALEVCPQLVKPGQGIEGLDVIAHTVGLRPVRIGGARVGLEVLPGDLKIVHNYGAGGFGFQSSWGMSYEALKFVQGALDKRHHEGAEHDSRL